jgi:HAD superfamily hydrolase (TIGR01509 family)
VVIKAAIFDLDGTIADFNLEYKSVRAEVRGFLIKKGVPASILSTNESIFEMLKKTCIFLKNNGKSTNAYEKIREEALAIAERYELEAAKDTSLLPGVTETLRTLRKKKLKTALFTINSEKSANYILKRFRIGNLFDTVVPRSRVRYVKPNPEHLETTLKALMISPAEALVVGDGSSDMRCAQELKVIAVGLLGGVSSLKELIASGANYVITSLIDLPILVEEINKTSEVHRS